LLPVELARHRSGLTVVGTQLGAAACAVGVEVLLRAGERRDRGVERAAGGPAAGAEQTVHADRHPLRQLLDRVLDAEVVRNRVEATGVHDPGAGPDGALVVADVHPVDELGLAGEVEVVRARVRTRCHEWFAVLDVGADRGGDDLRRLGQSLEGPRVGDVRDEDVLAEDFQLLLIASGNSPLEVGRRVFREVLRGQGPGEPARAEQHDVVLAAHLVAAFAVSARPPAPEARDDSAAPRV
jgi:hypothetical protein